MYCVMRASYMMHLQAHVLMLDLMDAAPMMTVRFLSQVSLYLATVIPCAM